MMSALSLALTQSMASFLVTLFRFLSRGCFG